MTNQVSDLLKRNADKIMKTWEERANDEIFAAFHLKSLSLRNSLPELLSQIADALSTTIDRSAARVRRDRKESLRIGRKHGHERAGSLDYTMDQMIFEYHILREVIFDVIEDERPLDPIAREVIVCAIEQSVNDAATQFSETLRSIQQRLASTLTHDLLGPITVVKILAQSLDCNLDDVDFRTKAGDRISKNMDRLDSMIRELLDASMILAGERLALKIEEFDLDLMLEEMVEELNLIYENRFVFLSKPPVKGFWSKSGIRRVVENLASNAAKYSTPETPITITLDPTDSHVTVSVHNEGTPIPEAEQPILFQQFRRAQSSQTKTGWGLGLTVVKGVIEVHQGTVRIVSAEGQGTTFIVEFPRDARALEASVNPPQIDIPPTVNKQA